MDKQKQHNMLLHFLFVRIPANFNLPSLLYCQAIRLVYKPWKYIKSWLTLLQPWTYQVLNETDFLRKCCCVAHYCYRRLQWHTKWERMFPWRSSFKSGWCSQQLVNAFLTLSVMGNKLSTSNMETSVVRAFSHLFIRLDISERETFNSPIKIHIRWHTWI